MTDGDSTVDPPGDDATRDPHFARLLEKLHADHGFDFREYKPPSLARRIRARMQQVHADSFQAYIVYLDRHADEHVALFNTILINVTAFFRDPDAWKVLAEDIVPRLIDETADSRNLRIWSTGCSSGEEAYSLAILLSEHLGDRANALNIKIYATDVDEDALQAARQGLYRVEQLRDMPAALLDRYFTREGQTYRVRRDLRRWVIFGRHNVAQDPPLSHIDLLVCRNVLIYFSAELQDRILARFHYAVRDGGFLFLGRSESLLARSRWFAPYHVKWRIFQRTTAPAATPIPVVAAAGAPRSTPAATPAREDPPLARLQRMIDGMPSGAFLIDASDTVLVWNAAAEALYDVPAAHAVGRPFRDLEISYRIEGLRARIEEVKLSQIPARLEHVSYARGAGDLMYADITILPIVAGAEVTAVAVYGTDATEAADIKDQMARLSEQHTTAIEELQSTNEELETTNEELQSTNEELETTNEELQSTNEELETTVEELQATNAELGALNAELAARTAELKHLDDYQRAVLSSLEHAVVVLDREGVATTWNHTAERLWGLRAESVIGRPFGLLPLGDAAIKLRDAASRVLATGAPETLNDVAVPLPTGAMRRMAMAVTPLKTASGEITGVVGVVSVVDDA